MVFQKFFLLFFTHLLPQSKMNGLKDRRLGKQKTVFYATTNYRSHKVGCNRQTEVQIPMSLCFIAFATRFAVSWEPKYCSRQPTRCLSQACSKLNKNFGIDCSDEFIRQKVMQKLILCQDWTKCFIEMDDVYKVSTKNCRAYPSLCMPYACLFLNAFHETDCRDLNIQSSLMKAMKGCTADNVNRCLKPVLIAQFYKGLIKIGK